MFSFLKREPKPVAEDWLDVGDGHRIHYLVFGCQTGRPVIVFHGGPGGSASPFQTGAFNLKTDRVILFDQRGCGKSTYTDVTKNNTPDAAVEDAVKICARLQIELKDLIVSGISYGSTLALLFAEKYPQAVRALVLGCIFLARAEDLVWDYGTSRLFYPDLLDEINLHAKDKEDVLTSYYEMLFSDNYEQMKTAVQYIGSYERQLGKTDPQLRPITGLTDRQIAKSRVYFYMMKHNFFLSDNQIIDQRDRIQHIPTLIVHNRLDMCCPFKQAYDLHRALPLSEMHVVADSGHGSPKMFKLYQKYAERFLSRVAKGEFVPQPIEKK